MSYLGLDAGTTGLKAALYGPSGRRLAFASFEYPIHRPQPGHAELSPEVLWEAACEAIRSVTAQAPQSPPKALAVSGQGESVVALDGNGAPLSRFIVNVDSRAGAELEELVHSIGAERLFRLTGLPPNPMSSLPKIAWLRKHRPEIFARARHFRFVQDYLLTRLGAEPGVDRSMASRTLAMDLESGDWSDDLLACAGIAREQLSPIVASDAVLGTVSEETAATLGLPRGTLCIAGGHDQACCNAGAGDMLAGTAVDGTGTFECLSLLLREPHLGPEMLAANLSSEPHTLPGLFFTFAYVPAGAVLRWVRDQFARDTKDLARARSANAYELLLSDLPDEPTDLAVFPYVMGTGTPWLDSKAGGSILGYSQHTTREQVVKGALEGICFEMRVNLELLASMGIRVSRIYATGGGARSKVWLQLKADIYGCDVIPVDEEASCLGAALCAAVGSGYYSSWTEAMADTRRRGPAVTPRPVHSERYACLFERYRELQDRLYGLRRKS